MSTSRRARELVVRGLVGLALAWGIAEAGWRLFSYPPLFVLDPVFDFALRPSAQCRYRKVDVDQEVLTNSHGFHDEEYPRKKPPGTRRVLVIGNSFMEATQVSVADTFAKRLQGELSGMRVQTVNASRADRGCLDYELVLDQVAWGFEPDLVLVAFAMTDPWHDSVSSPRMDHAPDGRPLRYTPTGINRHVPWLKPLLHRSWAIKHAMSAGAVVWTKVREQRLRAPAPVAAVGRQIPYSTSVTRTDGSPEAKAMWELSLGALRRMGAACRARRVPMMILIVPGEDQVNPLPGVAAWTREPQRLVTAFGQAEGIPVLDLAPAFEAARGTPHYFSEGHWNPRGNALAAREAGAFIARAGLLGR